MELLWRFHVFWKWRGLFFGDEWDLILDEYFFCSVLRGGSKRHVFTKQWDPLLAELRKKRNLEWLIIVILVWMGGPGVIPFSVVLDWCLDSLSHCRLPLSLFSFSYKFSLFLSVIPNSWWCHSQMWWKFLFFVYKNITWDSQMKRFIPSISTIWAMTLNQPKNL